MSKSNNNIIEKSDIKYCHYCYLCDRRYPIDMDHCPQCNDPLFPIKLKFVSNKIEHIG